MKERFNACGTLLPNKLYTYPLVFIWVYTKGLDFLSSDIIIELSHIEISLSNAWGIKSSLH